MVGSRDNVTVLGGGRVGTALSLLSVRAGHSALIWDDDESVVADINERHENTRYLSKIKLPEAIRATTDLEEAVTHARVQVLAVPGNVLTDLAGDMGQYLSPDQIILHASSRIALADATIQTASSLITDQCCVKKVGVLAGPLLEGEMVGKQPAALVVASAFREAVDSAQWLFTSERFQVFASPDLIGVELGAALSEVYAVALGIAEGLGFGSGTCGVLTARSLAEMTRFGAVLGARTATFSGLSGLGDLVACVSGKVSPAFRLGMLVGQGRTAREGTEEIGEPVEALHTAGVAASYARSRGVPMPILMRVYAIAEGRLRPNQAADRLISIEAGSEADVTMDLSALDLPLPTTAPRGGAGKA